MAKPIKPTPPISSKPVPTSVPPTKVRTAQVLFTQKRLLAANLKPPFVNDEGTFKDPAIVVENGHEPSLPKSVSCGKSLVIYSSAAEVVENCKGLSGPKDGANRLVQTARANANKAADKIPCADGCVKHVVELWHGWQCIDLSTNPPPELTAIAAVEVEIQCRIET